MTQQLGPNEAVSYVRRQAEKGLESLAALMERTAGDCAACLEAMTERQAAFKQEGEWSAKEIIGHLTGAMTTINDDIVQVAGGRRPRVEYRTGETSGYERPIEGLRQRLAREWSRTIDIVRSLSPEDSLKAMPPHPLFGPLSLGEWIAFARLHALDHVQQIEKMKSAPGYPKG